MLDKARAERFADELDLDGVFACPACLCDLAWRIRSGEQLHWQTVGATASLVWPELAPTLELALIDARMREVHDAEDALRDLRERAWRSPLARTVVLRLAQRMAAEIAERS